MRVKLTGTKAKHMTIELAVEDLLALVASYKRCLANPERSVAEHNVAAEAVAILTAELHDKLAKQGFADPAGIVEYVDSYVTDDANSRRALHQKLTDLRNSPLAYFSAEALRFAEPRPMPPCYWPNNSSDAP